MEDALSQVEVARGRNMTVAAWESWSVANMLISAYGDEAEAIAQANLTRCLEAGKSGEIIVWKEVITKIAEIRGGHG